MSAAPLLAVEALETAYGASQVLFGIDLEVRAGEVVGLLGRNGMGKTTLVRSILGLVASRAGRIAFDGTEVRGLPADRIARLGLAVVPEGRQVFPNLSVDEHLTAFAARRGGEAAAGLGLGDQLRLGSGELKTGGFRRSSILSDAPLPIQGVYSASKHAVKGFTNALRMELMREQAPITVSLIKPAAVDSPSSKHARKLTGYATQNPQPVYATHVVADTILYCASHPIREITVGGGGRLIASFYSVLPGLAEPLFARFAPSLMRDRRSAWEPDEDGLYGPGDDGRAEEVHYPMVRQFSALAEVRKHPGITSGVLAVLAGIGIAALLLKQRSGPTRNERLRGRIDPRGWIDTGALNDRFGGLAHALRRGLSEAGERAADLGGDARRRSEQVLRGARHSSRKALKKHGKTAQRYAHDAGAFARDHAKEGGALLALATIAAAIGAAALDVRRPDSRIRKPGQF